MAGHKVTLRRRLRRIEVLGRWADELLRTLPLADAIRAIDGRRRGADGDDNYTLTLELKGFLLAAGREEEAEQIIDEMIARLPDDVRFPISRASLYLYDKKDPEKAVEAI